MPNEITVGQLLFDCLHKVGITEIFGVPGDYNFSLLDTLDQYEGINFVNCRNELNAGYAADGYSRIKGLGAIITTFGVGELSACNAIAGSYSESVPVVHIVGAPKDMVQKEHKLMHHTLLDGNYDVFKKVYKNLTEYTATLTCENAAFEIPAAIQKAKETKKPVYLVVAIDIVTQPIFPRDFTLQPKKTNTSSMQEAIKQIISMLQQAKQPVLISDLFVLRYSLENKVKEIAEKMNIPVVTMMMGKGSFDESHQNFKGFYCGTIGDENVRSFVESSDCILAIGPVWNDYNTGVFTARLNPLQIIDIQPCHVKVGMTVYENVLIVDLLTELQNLVCAKTAPLPQVNFPFESQNNMENEAITAKYYYPRFQKMLRENDIVIAESGTLAYGVAQIRLKSGITYITQGGWGCIGYALPATFGACVGAPDRRVILFTGDGSLQLTVQEISSMLENGNKPIIFILNNRGYTIEKYINVPLQTGYNEIPNWDYTKLPEVFGGNVYVSRVFTNKELDDAIIQAEEQNKTRMCLIEMIVPPMDAPEIVLKMHQVLENMQK